jgi:DNA-binding transcriptional MocR family regulator
VSVQYQVSGSSAASISASIEAGIRGGDFRTGAALPSVRILAGALHVSPATVAKAYQELRSRGVLETVGRQATRVRTRPAVDLPRSALRLAVPPGMTDLSAGDPDVRLLPGLAPHVRAVAGRLGRPSGYAASGALPEFVAAARARLAADGVPMEAAAITVTSGTLDAIERLLTAHLRPGDRVAVEDPGWVDLLDLLAALGLTPVPFAVDDDGPLPEALAAALGKGVGAVVITTRAQNPIGAAVSADRATALRPILAGHAEVLLIEDDHAAELAGVALRCLSGATGAWAFVRSASKPYGPDLRIAVLAGDEATIGRVVGRMRIGAGWVSTLLQRLLLALWEKQSVTAGVAAAAASYDRRRTALRTALSDRGLPAHGRTGINVWVTVPDETRAVSALRDAGYAVAPGSLFRIASPPGLRVTVSPLAETDAEPLADAILAAVSPTATRTQSR